MDKLKELAKTKTFWGGIAAIGLGITLCATGDTKEGLLSILGGLQTIFIRDALIKKVP